MVAEKEAVRKSLRAKLAAKKKKNDDEEEYESDGSADSDLRPYDPVEERLKGMSKDELKEVLKKDPEVTDDDLAKLSADEMRDKIRTKYKESRSTPCGKCCLGLGALFLFLILFLRISEELYNPGMEVMESQFRLLGLSGDATDTDIRKAYRQKARKLHPDKNPSCKDCAEKLHEINDAYEMLTTEKHINRYRKYREDKFKVAQDVLLEQQEFIKRGGKKEESRERRTRARSAEG